MTSQHITIEMLRRGARALDPTQWRQVKARVAWVKATVDRLRKAHRAMDECLAQSVRGTEARSLSGGHASTASEHGTGGEAVERLDEGEARSHAGAHGKHCSFERLCEAEQAKVDAIRAEIDDVIEHDRWPRGLHFGGI